MKLSGEVLSLSEFKNYEFVSKTNYSVTLQEKNKKNEKPKQIVVMASYLFTPTTK